MVSESWQCLSCSCYSVSPLPFANHPVLTDQRLHAASQKNLAPESLLQWGHMAELSLSGPVTVSAYAKSDTLKSPLIFRETLISRKFYGLCNYKVNKVNVSFLLPVVLYWVMQVKCMAVLPSAASRFGGHSSCREF